MTQQESIELQTKIEEERRQALIERWCNAQALIRNIYIQRWNALYTI